MTPPALRLRLTGWRLAICRFSPDAALPAWVFHTSAEVYSVTRTPHELSIVCAEDDLPPSVDTNVELGWAAFEVEGPLPFGLTGVISGITTPLAEAGISVFVISTYDSDYLLVRALECQAVARILATRFVVA